MDANRRIRRGLFALATIVALLLPTVAAGHDGGGGGGTPTTTGAPAVTFNPTSLTYGAQAIGTTSAPQSITITNTGSASLFVNSAQTRGTDPLDFTQVGDSCSGVTLAPGTSCSVSITFKPIASG